MRRERSQSSDRGRPYVPRWDNPTGQLPGTGIPSGSDSGLHGTSRRRDSSVPERSRLRTSESGAPHSNVSNSLLRYHVKFIQLRSLGILKTKTQQETLKSNKN